MSLDPAFITKHRPLGLGYFNDAPVEDMTRDELIAVIGWLSMEREHDKKQARHDFDFAMSIART